MIDNDMVQSKDNKPPKGSIWEEIAEKDLVFVMSSQISRWSPSLKVFKLTYPMDFSVPPEWLRMIYNPIFLTLGTEVNVPLYYQMVAGTPLIYATTPILKVLTEEEFRNLSCDMDKFPPSSLDIEIDKERARKDIINYFKKDLMSRPPSGDRVISVPSDHLDILGEDGCDQLVNTIYSIGFKADIERGGMREAKIIVHGFNWEDPHSYISSKEAKSKQPIIAPKKPWTQRIADWLNG